ncbi:unnamed protein product [Dovyalis caffra]|uniref:Uncharacterized protein n=1 Tax=Dovyalis caffra TaxID=77055 RepID=A0AAV1RLW9_9ROSI|nr:unnamed protein product [Dovyalis caffra]
MDVEVKSWGTGGGLRSQQLVQIAMLTTKVFSGSALSLNLSCGHRGIKSETEESDCYPASA